MGIGWRTIVGVMLIGFKTEGINLPSFIMVPRGPFSLFVSPSCLSFAKIVSSPTTFDTHLHEIPSFSLSQDSIHVSTEFLTTASLKPMPVSAVAIDPRCFDWGLKYEVYLGGVKTSFVLAIAQNFVSLLNLLDITFAWRIPIYF